MDAEQAVIPSSNRDGDVNEAGIADVPLSVADSITQIQDLLNEFTVRCDDQIISLKDDFIGKRPRISWWTISLAIIVAGLTTATGSLMISTGASTAQLAISALGELFLFGLVIASGLADLFWREPTKLMLARNAQISRIAGIEDEIIRLAQMRQEWETDVEWHRARCGDAREELAQTNLQLADTVAEYEQKLEAIATLHEELQNLEQTVSVERERKLEEVEAELGRLNAAIEDARARKLELDENLTKISGSIAEANRSLVTLTEELTLKQDDSKLLDDQVADKRAQVDDADAKLYRVLEEVQQAEENLAFKNAEFEEINGLSERLDEKARSAAEVIAKQELALVALVERFEQASAVSNLVETSNNDAAGDEAAGDEVALNDAAAENGTASFAAAYVDSVERFAESVAERIERLHRGLAVAATQWDESANAIFALEYEISDRQQIAEALSLQLQLLEDQLIKVDDRRIKSLIEIQDAEQQLGQIVEQLSDRRSELTSLDDQVSASEQLKQDVAKQLISMRGEVRSLRVDWLDSCQAMRADLSRNVQDVEAVQLKKAAGEIEFHGLQQLIQEKTTEFSAVEENLAKQVAQFDALQDKIRSAELARDQKIALLLRLREDVKDLTEEVQSVLSLQRRSIEDIEDQIGEKKRALQAHSDEMIQAEQSLARVRGDVRRAEEDRTAVRQEITEKSEQLAQLSEAISAATEELESTKQRTSTSQQQHDILQSRILLLSGQLDDLQNEFGIAIGAQQEEFAVLEDQVSDVIQRIGDKSSELERVEEAVVAAERAREVVQSKADAIESSIGFQQGILTELSEAIASKNAESDRISDELRSLEISRRTLKQQVADEISQLRELEELIERTRHEEDRQRATVDAELKELLEEVEHRRAASRDLELSFDQIAENLRLAEQRLAEIESQVTGKADLLTALESEVEAMKAEQVSLLDELKAEQQDRAAELDRTGKELEALQFSLAEQREKLMTVDLQTAERLRYAEALEREAKQAEDALQKLTQSYDAKRVEFEEITAESDTIEAQVSEHKMLLADLVDELSLERERHSAELAELQSSIQDSESQIAVLVEKRASFEAYIADLANRIEKNEMDLALVQRSLEDQTQLVREQDMKIQSDRQQLDALHEEVVLKQRELAELENKADAAMHAATEAEERMRDLIESCSAKEQQIELLEREAGQRETAMAAVQERLDDLSAELDARRDELDQLRSERDGLNSEVNTVEQQLEEQRKVGLDQESKLEAVKLELAAKTEELERLRSEVLDADQLAGQWRVYLEETAQEKAKLEESRQQIASELDRLKAAMTETQSELIERQKETDAQLEDRTGTLAALDSDIQSHEEVLSELRVEEERLRIECQRLRDELQTGQRKLAETDQQIENLRSQQLVLENQIVNAKDEVRLQEEAARDFVRPQRADEAETMLGRVEGLVQELGAQLENQVSAEAKAFEPEEKNGSNKVDSSGDLWDDVLS